MHSYCSEKFDKSTFIYKYCLQNKKKQLLQNSMFIISHLTREITYEKFSNGFPVSKSQSSVPLCKMRENWAKMANRGKQNQTQTCPSRQVIFRAESSQCNSPLFKRVAGQVEVLAGQVNFMGSLPCSASNVLEPMLNPGVILTVVCVHTHFKNNHTRDNEYSGEIIVLQGFFKN